MRLALPAGLLLGISCSAAAQIYPSASMEFRVALTDSGNANGTVEPGEVVDVRVTAEFFPPVGGLVRHNWWGWVGTMYSFAGSIIDLTGVQSSHTGALAFAVPAALNVGLPGTLSSVTQSVQDSNAGQLVFLPLLPGTQANPVEILVGTWTPANYEPRTLAYALTVDSGSVYMIPPFSIQPTGDNSQNAAFGASIPIVPGSGTMWLVAAAAGLGARRRRP